MPRGKFSLKAGLVTLSLTALVLGIIMLAISHQRLEKRIVGFQKFCGFQESGKPWYRFSQVGAQSTGANSTDFLGAYLVTISDPNTFSLKFEFVSGSGEAHQSRFYKCSGIQTGISIRSLKSELSGELIGRQFLVHLVDEAGADKYEEALCIEYWPYFMSIGQTRQAISNEENLLFVTVFSMEAGAGYNLDIFENPSLERMKEFVKGQKVGVLKCSLVKN